MFSITVQYSRIWLDTSKTTEMNKEFVLFLPKNEFYLLNGFSNNIGILHDALCCQETFINTFLTIFNCLCFDRFQHHIQQLFWGPILLSRNQCLHYCCRHLWNVYLIKKVRSCMHYFENLKNILKDIVFSCHLKNNLFCLFALLSIIKM